MSDSIPQDTPIKHCPKCNRDLPATLSYFSRSSTSKDAFQQHCKSCKHDYYARAEAAANPNWQKEREQRQQAKELARSGIYAIVNLANQHFYVGSATSLIQRKQHHFKDLEAGTHKNAHLQRAYHLYGADSFRFDVLEYVEHVKDLLTREQYYIDTLNPEYNIARTAGSNLGTKVSPETKSKMRAARLSNEHMLEQMAKLAANRRGKHLSAEHIAKRSATNRGKKHSPEHKAKLSASLLGKKKTPEHAAHIRAAKLGKKRSPETIAKIAASKRGKKHSAETKAKMSAAHLRKKMSSRPQAVQLPLF